MPFLDTLVTVEVKNSQTSIETELYIKPMNSGIILHSSSAHPTSTKHNIIRNMFHRAMNNSSNKEKADRSIRKIWDLLVGNGYTPKVLERLLKEVRKSRSAKGEGGRRAKKGKGGDREHGGNRDKSGYGFLSLPYIDEQLLCKA